MKIQTRQFSFTRRIYLGILWKNSLRRNWWMLILLGAIAVYSVIQKEYPPLGWIALAAVVFLAFLGYRCWRHASAKQNPLFYHDRWFEIDGQFINCRFPSGVLNQINLKNIRGVAKTRDHYQLYLNKKQFVYLPFAAFETDRDRNLFETLLRGRGGRR